MAHTSQALSSHPTPHSWDCFLFYIRLYLLLFLPRVSSVVRTQETWNQVSLDADSRLSTPKYAFPEALDFPTVSLPSVPTLKTRLFLHLPAPRPLLGLEVRLPCGFLPKLE